MLEFLDGFSTKLQSNLSTTQDTITICKNAVDKLNTLSEGNHVYLTIKYLDRYEVVKFIKDQDIVGNKIHITRDMLSKGRKNFPCGACVVVDFNSIQLTEFIKQVVG